MEYRHELKFIVNDFDIAKLRARLWPSLQPDENSGEAGYMIRSLYFDDAHDSALYEKQDGVNLRAKFRMRIYNYADETVYLEKKEKVNTFTRKTRTRLTREEAEHLIRGDEGFPFAQEDTLLRDFWIKRTCNRLRPVQLVDYHRLAYRCAHGNVRITLDTQVSAPLAIALFEPALPRVPAMPQGCQILEIKYDEFIPDYIQQLLQMDVGRPQACSKYLLCRLAAMR